MRISGARASSGSTSTRIPPCPGRSGSPSWWSSRQDAYDLSAKTLLTCGTSALKQRLLRRLPLDDVVMCLLYSERGASSDLARLQTRADRETRRPSPRLTAPRPPLDRPSTAPRRRTALAEHDLFVSAPGSSGTG